MADRPPYESMAPTREQLEELYRGFTKAKILPLAEEETDFWREQLADFGIAVEVPIDWRALAYDIRLVNLALSDRVQPNEPGNRKKAERVKRLADELERCAKAIGSLSWDSDIILAGLTKHGSFSPNISEILATSRTLRDIAEQLARQRKQPRWREAAMRSLRVELACLLAPVFSLHFREAPIPKGGSHYRKLDELNNWTRFFQAVADAFWGEKVTPDRQQILWEACQAPASKSSDILESDG